MKLVKHTSQAFILSLNIITRNNNDTRLIPIPLVTLTTIIFALWTIRQYINRLRSSMAILVEDITTKFLDSCEAFYIGVNVVWGVVRL